jgi:hypothetical protein
MRDVDADMLGLIRQEAVTPDEVAKRLGISWARAASTSISAGGLPHKPSTFKWIRPKPLEQLSDELAGYFPRDLTATEMIEKERRKA